ncbi:unnamed protein product [Rotaria sp. Silwood1]|nr:unnamed protein product [Rotaria sp. Silwood1]CAF3381055.1 unnamed protein product [Rotaria sp. Silwood1]CAF3387985.1 unnamed protein product [Rotaria sp. Silwood1]CAF4698034.1 unnamed protein product [Rotaria sp. Silwood1]CAF4746023.1 unnamed protein product [Rotaria sp. Silwood1]
MSLNETENDAEIARILAEEYTIASDSFSPNSSKTCWSVSSENFIMNDTQQIETSISKKENQKCLQHFEEDNEIAFILQIEEIVLSENKINEKTININNTQLEKTHEDMTKALQPTKESDLATRIFGMFATIQTRYANCQTKNQTLIEQIQRLSVQLYPLLVSFKTQGRTGISRAAVPTLAIGLITNVLQGSVQLNDAKEIMLNMLQIWNESNIWYEFFEQLVYILVAITVPSFAQGAMGKIMAKISPLK